MIQNEIENFYQEFIDKFPEISTENFSMLYIDVKPPRLAELFTNIHAKIVDLIKSLNTRLPTGDSINHFWAEPSRDFRFIIDLIDNMSEALEKTAVDFEVDSYYAKVFDRCKGFLQETQGSQIPEHMEKIKIYYRKPIFIQGERVAIDSISTVIYSKLINIGSGSYGTVYKFFDNFYGAWFALKRAKKTLNEKELDRFKKEYTYLSGANSPFIVKVYCYKSESNEYIMELVDFSLDEYYKSKNNKVTFSERKLIGLQIIRAIKYINSKGLFHRDICPKNILIKCYDDTVITKVSDFGLIKDNTSTLTSIDSDIKGSFNDPDLEIVGFQNYSLKHEIYALTRTLRFVLTGITSLDRDIKENIRQFAEKGMCSDCSRRYQSIQEVEEAFKQLKDI